MEDLSVELKELLAKSSVLHSNDLASLCLVNKAFNAITTRILYRHVTIKTPKAYLGLKHTLATTQWNRKYIYRLDFSGYTSRGSRLTEEKATQLIIPHQLVQMVRDCEQLKELLIGEEMLSLAGASLYRAHSIFTHSSQLETIDLTGFCNRDYEPPSHYSYMDAWPIPKILKNVSFYMSIALDLHHFLIPFFKRLDATRLKHLDLGHTKADPSLFLHLHNTTSLTHLSMKGCFSIHCCSPFIDFLQNNASHLIQLNLDMLHRGNSAPFCQPCLLTIMKSINRSRIESLDLGGHPYLDDSLLQCLLSDPAPFTRLRYLSLGLTNVTTSGVGRLLPRLFPQLFYINLAKPFLEDYDYQSLIELFNTVDDTSIQVVEVGLNSPIRYPGQIEGWTLTIYGRRIYYSRNGVDPSFVYAKKMILIDQQQLSPMNKYLCYSY